jgi:penicillin-binding protein 1A
MADTTNKEKNSKTKVPTNKNKAPKKNVKKKKHPILRFFKIFFVTLLCLIIIGSVATLGFVLAMIKTAPPLDINGTILNLSQTSTLYDDTNQVMDNVLTTQKRTVVPMGSIPQNLSHAFVSIEDERFYSHGGIDPKRIAGALVHDVLNKIHKQNSIEGASTITQELIKQRMFLTDSLENRISLKRKVQEAYLAIQLEKYLTKDQILEAYMNTIYLGGQANGVEAASEQYFNTDVNNLNLIQCAFLAGLVQSPSNYYPFSGEASKNPSLYLNRTKTVLSTMLENNYISDTDYNNAINDLNGGKLKFTQNGSSSNSYYQFPWFSSAAVAAVKADLKAQYDYTDEQVDSLLTNGGLKIYTTMNRNLENSAFTIMNATNTSYEGDGKAIFGTDKRGLFTPQAAATITDYRTGQVKALIGGIGTQPPSSYNRATNGYLSATGSSIKPLSVYAPAIENKFITAGTEVQDSGLSPDLQYKYGSPGNPYNPKDDTGGFSGINQTISTAITQSINVIAVKVEDKIGLSTGSSYATKFGVIVGNDKNNMASMALGEFSGNSTKNISDSTGANTTIMSSAYGTFGDNGVLVAPKLYTKVVDSKGTVILDNSQPVLKRVISPDTAYIMYNMLKGPVSSAAGSTGPNASKYTTMPVAGKTGTSSMSDCLWFCGLSPYYSAAVWIGNDNPNISLNGKHFSSNTAANVWGLLMAAATKNLPVTDLTAPNDLVNINGQYYIQGTEPTVETPPPAPTTDTTPAPDTKPAVQTQTPSNSSSNGSSNSSSNSSSNGSSNGSINSSSNSSSNGSSNGSGNGFYNDSNKSTNGSGTNK